MDERCAASERPHPGVRRALRVLIVVGCLAGFAGEFYNCVFCCDHDFLWHRNFGLSFINDQVYIETGQHYLPTRAMFDATMAWMPYRVDRTIWFLAMCMGLACCIRFWSRVGQTNERWTGPALVAFLVAVTYVHRDLAECGLQIFLLCLLTAAYSALSRGLPARCGVWLGLAAMYKVMPIIFLPYLLWKRQWKAALGMAATVCLVSLLPGLYLGWQKNLQLHAQWVRTAAERLAIEDPSENGIETPALWNRSLPLALARLVQDYPPDHPLYVENSGNLRLATLAPRAAKRFVQCSLLALAALLAWQFRHRASFTDGGAAMAGQWAMVCILVAELSPLCWLHHLVLAMPAMLLFAQTAGAGRAYWWQIATATVASALVLLVHRGILSESLWSMASAIHPHTVACLLFGAVALSPGKPVPLPNLVAQPESRELSWAA